MATITLWHTAGSPPAWAVRMVADILGIMVELKPVNFAKKEHKTSEFKKMNPMGTIPVIQDGDLYHSESHTIIKYLLDKYGNEEHKKLYPSDRVQKAAVDQINFFDCGVAFIRIKRIFTEASHEGHTEPCLGAIEETNEVYDIIEWYLDGKIYIASDEFTVADISLGSTVISLNAVIPVDEVKYPRTVAWLDHLRCKPFVQKIALPGSETMYANLSATWKCNKDKQKTTVV